MREWHTALNILNTFSKTMDVIFPECRTKIIGASSDGERKMTGGSQGVETRIQLVAASEFMRVWCSAHQLDLCMQAFYFPFPD